MKSEKPIKLMWYGCGFSRGGLRVTFEYKGHHDRMTTISIDVHPININSALQKLDKTEVDNDVISSILLPIAWLEINPLHSSEPNRVSISNAIIVRIVKMSKLILKLDKLMHDYE